MLSLCLIYGLQTIPLETNHLTLTWMHSVEKIRWEEDYERQDAVIKLQAARIQGSGAGMDPPEDAIFKNGFWSYQPILEAQPSYLFRLSRYTKNYEICIADQCRIISDYFTNNQPLQDVVELTVCRSNTKR